MLLEQEYMKRPFMHSVDLIIGKSGGQEPFMPGEYPAAVWMCVLGVSPPIGEAKLWSNLPKKWKSCL